MSLTVAIIVPPVREKVSFYPPFGALGVIAAARSAGHKAHLIDLDALRCSKEEAVNKISQLSPDVVGLSAVVSTSYKYVKEMAVLIKQKMPNVTIVVGGGLAAAWETVLNHTLVDVLVHGEGEITFKELLKNIENKEDLDGIDGISFRKEGKPLKNKPRRLIMNLDDLPFPDYDILDSSKYILTIHDFIKGYVDNDRLDKRLFEPRRSPKFMRVTIGRGCIGSCSFCYRNMPGLRIHSLEYIADLIAHLKKKYDVGHISFGDECFGSTKKWVWDFIDMLRKNNFDLTFHITGMRVDIMDRDILKALKEAGIWHIQFGFESGSQKILNIMEKHTTVQQNIEVSRMVKEVGINTIPFIIIGYPGETFETIYETIDFLRKANLASRKFRPTFPMAMPGAPLFEYAQLKGYITDVDKYLEAISNVEAAELSPDNYFINYTTSPTPVVMKWMILLENEINSYTEGRSFLKLTKKVIRKLKERGFNKTFLLAKRRIISIVEGKIFERKYYKKKNAAAKSKDLPVLNNQTPEIPPQGLALREINKRLKDLRAK